MLRIALIVVAALFAVVLGLAAMQPDQFRVERTIAIKAPPEKILAVLDDFKRWQEWSPWEGLDPAMQRQYSVVSKGVGATYTWTGNSDVGSGRMEIVKLTEKQMLIALTFMEPMEAHHMAEFKLATRDDVTEVTWAMYGGNSWPCRIMQVFVSMDSMVGKDFENGLARLKSVSER